MVELRGFEPLTFSLRMASALASTSAERLGCNASEDSKRTNCASGVRRGYALQEAGIATLLVPIRREVECSGMPRTTFCLCSRGGEPHRLAGARP